MISSSANSRAVWYRASGSGINALIRMRRSGSGQGLGAGGGGTRERIIRSRRSVVSAWYG